jgi:hypothetical protein
MPSSEEKIQKLVANVLERPSNVDPDELQKILRLLGATERPARHGVIYRIPGCSETLMLNPHNNGKKHLPKYCVQQFRARMSELGLC